MKKYMLWGLGFFVITVAASFIAARSAANKVLNERKEADDIWSDETSFAGT